MLQQEGNNRNSHFPVIESLQAPNSRIVEWRDVYHRAESLYDIGEYEQALVWYHKGRRMKPNEKEFIKGVLKCEEAIAHRLPANLQNIERNADKMRSRSRGSLKRVQFSTTPSASTRKSHVTDNYDSDEDPYSGVSRVPKSSKDKQYLQAFLDELGNKTANQNGKIMSGYDVKQILSKGLKFIDTRTIFWKQRMPTHAIDALKTKPPTVQHSAVGTLQVDPHNEEIPNSIFMTLLTEMMKANQEFINRQYMLCIPRCESCIKILKKLKSTDMENKYEMLSYLHSLMGNSFFELEKHDEAIKCFTKDLDIACDKSLVEAKSRALENMGRVYARVGEFDTAIHVWKDKLALCQSSREKSWLYHEIGYCYLSKLDFFSGKHYGSLSCEQAQEATDARLEMNATVLTAECEGKLKDFASALKLFRKAAGLAANIGDRNERKAIKEAIRNLEKTVGKQNQHEMKLPKPVPPPEILLVHKSSQREARNDATSDVYLSSYFEKDEESESQIELSSVPSNSLKTSIATIFNKPEEPNNANGKSKLEAAMKLSNQKDPFSTLKLDSSVLNNNSLRSNSFLAKQTGLVSWATKSANKKVLNPVETSKIFANNSLTKHPTSKDFLQLQAEVRESVKDSDVNIKDKNRSSQTVSQDSHDAKDIKSPSSQKKFFWDENPSKNVFTKVEISRRQDGSVENRSPPPLPSQTPKSSFSDNLTLIQRKNSAQTNKKFQRSHSLKPIEQSTTKITRNLKQEAFQNKYLKNRSDSKCKSTLPSISVSVQYKQKPMNLASQLPPIAPEINKTALNDNGHIITQFPQMHNQKHLSTRRRYMSPRIENQRTQAVDSEFHSKPIGKREGVVKHETSIKHIENVNDDSDMEILKMLLDM